MSDIDFLAKPPVEEHEVGRRASVGGTTRIRKRQPWWKLGGKDYAFVSVDQAYLTQSGAVSSDIENARQRKDSVITNVYQDADAAELYKPIGDYEGTHRFDPSFAWTKDEEKALVKSLDWRITLPACVMFFALQLDRGNVTQALADNMLKDLGLSTNDYNNGMTIFYCSFLAAELPSQIIGKKLGPDVWLPTQMVAWSIVAASQARLTGRTSFFVTRFLLGVCEGGFIPDMILYLSYCFKNGELAKRLSFFWTSYQGTQIIGALLAYGIFHLRGDGGLVEGWRYLFAIEGAITAFIGVLTFLYLPASAVQTGRRSWKGILRPKKGWYTEREEKILVTRIVLDDPGKATMHNRQALDIRRFWKAITDYDLWPVYLIGLTWQIPMTPESNYLTLTCQALGFNTFQTSLLTIPASVLFIIQLLFWTWVSEKLNQRMLVGLISQLWVFPLLLALELLPPSFPNANWVKWTISTMIIGYPYAHAILVALTSRNAGLVRTRAVASALYNISVQVAGVLASQVYRADDAPYYYRGNKVLLAILAYNVVLFCSAKAYYSWKNSQRDRVWDSMTRNQRLEYLATTKEEGNKRLDFRFAS